MKKTSIIFNILLFFCMSCSQEIDRKNFNSFLSEPCMIVNQEQDNTIEGEYLIVEETQLNDSCIKIKMPVNFYLNNSNCKNWILGWGTDKPLYDAGVENIRTIKKIDVKNNLIELGKLLRGNGLPKVNQRIVFWNTKPSGFYNYFKTPIINPSIWSEFSGKSISFGAIEYDSLLSKWMMIVNECDTNKIQIYAAMSSNLIDWQVANNGNPILTSADFKDCKWAEVDKTRKISQTPFVSDVIHYNNQWYLFFDGSDSDGKKQIGVATSENTLLGPYKINKEPIVFPQKNGWNDEACFHAKVKKYKNKFIMFYDGKNKSGLERVGMAYSEDLLSWKDYEKNPVIDQHTGWRSSIKCTEPTQIEIRGDSILLMLAGAKKFKMGAWHHYVTKRMYLDKSGNVDDAQVGVFLSTDGGKSFTAHTNNPIFLNYYSNPYENEHLGSNFYLIETDTTDFIFYQAKSSYQGLKYNIMLRTRKYTK